ncbi:zinc-binding dehydrogenase [Microlunatus elymi]|uniref:Zinc-binding dehydrogenase n=1 Tax=Microlunatus elymi TaxID=2596828 RepID=A0A516Q5G4_9ACTN|nr:zinc-binding dehydrogenase [Microlunatus elymi]
MRALVLHDFGELRIEERRTPAPGPGEVLIRICATGICGSDVHGYTGENGRRVPGQVMGHEAVGRVAGLGPRTEALGLSVGEPVTFNPVVLPAEQAAVFAGREQHCPDKTVIGVVPEIPAAFADYLVVPGSNVVALPQSMPIAYGALIEPLAVALHAVRRVLTPTVDRVLVVGGGPIGQSIVLALGVEGVDQVVVSEVDPARRMLLQRLGASVIDPTAGPIADAIASAGGPFEVVIDAVGVTASVRDALAAATLGGRICLVGMGSPALELPGFKISTEERTIIGSFTYSAQDFRDAAEFAASSDPRLAHLISRHVEPEEADATFRALGAGDVTAGKVLVWFDGRPDEAVSTPSSIAGSRS